MAQQTKTTAERITEGARALIGRRFVHHGRGMAGTDCVGVVVLALKHADAVPRNFDFTRYGPPGVQRGPEEPLAPLLEYGEAVAPQDLRPGDVAAFVVGGEKHVAVVTEEAGQVCMVHADAKLGKVVEHALTSGWRIRASAAVRFGGGL